MMSSVLKINSHVFGCLFKEIRMTRNLHWLKDKAYINGKWVGAKQQFEVYNPGTGEVVGCVPDLSVKDTEKAIEAAWEAFQEWQFMTAKERSRKIREMFDCLEDHKEDIAQIITAEIGKPLEEARAEVDYGNSFMEWFSEETRNIPGEIINSPVRSKRMFIERVPLGPVALITPWNFPFAMITRKTGAALAAGCTCIVKPSEETPFSALALAQAANEVCMPKGVFNVITNSRETTPEIAKLLCQHRLIAGISLTGSTPVGKIYFQLCAPTVKRMALELGGNAPFIVFESANIDKSVEGAMLSKFRNAGQACVAANRFLVQKEVHDCFVSKFAEAIKKMKMGVGTECNVDIGPVANKRQLKTMVELVKDAVCKGADVVTGGRHAKECGELFFEPTLLTGITKEMRVYKEEIFGPIAPVICFECEEEAIEIANSTEYGLAGYFYSENINQIFRVARRLEMGMLGINEGIVSSAETPFGGIKESGFGREGGHMGIDEYVYYKYVCYGIH